MRQASPYLEPRQPAFLPNLLGPLEMVTPPSAQVVTTAEAEKYLRADGLGDADEIAGILASAVAYCERQVPGGVQLRPATFDVPVRWFWPGELRLPRPPLQSVAWVKYFDAAGVLQTLDASQYLVRTPWRQPGTIERAPGVSWPAAQADRRFTVSIRFTAGYAADLVPDAVKQAVRFLASQWYEKRLPVGQATAEVANAVAAILAGEDWGSYA